MSYKRYQVTRAIVAVLLFISCAGVGALIAQTSQARQPAQPIPCAAR